MRKNRIYRNILLTLLVWGNSLLLAAQQSDSMALLKQFASVMASVGKPPLDMELKMQYSAIPFTQSDDTISLQASIHLREHGSYIRIGEQEQLTNDSLALLISDSLHRMILYRNASPVIQRMRSLPGIQWADSSVRKMAALYQVRAESAGLLLESRQPVPGTSFPGSSYYLSYDPAGHLPSRLLVAERYLVEVEAEDYGFLQQDTLYAGRLISRNGQYYVVKEKLLTIEYASIDLSADSPLPVRFEDRVVAMPGGGFQPAEKYNHYQLAGAR